MSAWWSGSHPWGHSHGLTICENSMEVFCASWVVALGSWKVSSLIGKESEVDAQG